MARKTGQEMPPQVDAVLAKQVEVARQALTDICQAEEIGEHLEAIFEAERVVTHHFACLKAGYSGWHWAVTMARAPRSRSGTVCEMCLLPGDGALLAPQWVPWAQRLQPGDLGRGDVLPLIEDDPNLDQGYEATGDEEADRLAQWELGLGRPRVLSAAGRDAAAKRWYRSARGPLPARALPIDQQFKCQNCGYLMLLAGSLRTQFGVCANPWSPDDGTVVSLDHACGAHSEADVPQTSGSAWPVADSRVDEVGIEEMSLEEPSE